MYTGANTEHETVDRYAAGRGPSRTGWPPSWLSPLGKLATNKANSPEARGSDPTTVDDLRAVKRSEAPTGLLGGDTASPKDCRSLPSISNAMGEGVIQRPPAAKPAPCPKCGCPVFWIVPIGGVACGNCCPRPDSVPLKAIVITMPDDRLAWEVKPIDDRRNLVE